MLDVDGGPLVPASSATGLPVSKHSQKLWVIESSLNPEDRLAISKLAARLGGSSLSGPSAPNIQDCYGKSEDDGAQNQAGGAKEHQAPHDGEEDRNRMHAQPLTHEDGIKQVIDQTDHDGSPCGENESFSRLTARREKNCRRYPYDECTENGNNGENCHHRSPQ